MHDVSCGGQLRHAATPQDRQIFQRAALGYVTDFTAYPVSRRAPRHWPGLGVNFSYVLVPSASAPSVRSAPRFRCAASLAASYRRLLARVIGCSVDDGFPYGGTVSKIRSHLVGAPRVTRARWALSTGRLVHRQRVDLEVRLLPAQTGVRRGVNSSPLQMPRITARTGSALARAVGR